MTLGLPKEREAPRLVSAGLRFVFLAGSALATILGPGSVLAQEVHPSEYQVKAAFLYHFIRFVEWPAGAFPSAGASLTLCILGPDPFGSILEQTIQGKAFNGSPLAIRRAKDAGELGTCHVLFISSSGLRKLGEFLGSHRNAAALTVGETERFAQQGGMISLLKEENRVGLAINPDAAEHAGLKISSKLLALARIVRDSDKRK